MKNSRPVVRGQKGFSLLEILVAFSILALSLTVLLKIFSSGIHTAIVSEEYANAVQVAESLLAKTGVESDLQDGISRGTDNEKYHWEISVNPYEPELEELEPDSFPVNLYRIIVRVSWGDDEENRRSVNLETLKMAVRSQ